MIGFDKAFNSDCQLSGTGLVKSLQPAKRFIQNATLELGKASAGGLEVILRIPVKSVRRQSVPA